MSKKLPPAWQHVETCVIFKHPRITVSEDTVILPSGRRTDWMQFREGPDFVKVICVDDRRRVLVASQYAHPPRRVVHEFPGGVVNTGERHEEAARRELVEEVGLYPRRLERIGSFLTNNRRSDRACVLFWATDFEARPATPDSEEFIEYEWLEIAALEQSIRAGEVENGILLACWTLFRLRYDEYFRDLRNIDHPSVRDT